MNEKRTGLFENGLIWFGAGVSIAEILTGTYLAPLGMGKGLAAILIGHIIGCLMLFLAATGSAAGTALPAAWPRTLCLTAKILLYIVAFAQIFVFMLLAYFCPQWFVPYCAALVVAGCLLMAAALRALRHIAVR